MKKNKGFTLIELLVVIAIIGILASIVLASLNSARSKGGDAAVKANLSGIRAAAELYYDGSGASTYGPELATAGACPTSGTTMFFADTSVKNAIAAAKSAGGGFTACMTDDTASNNASKWAVVVQLKTDATKAWCVDSSGKSQQVSDTAAFDQTSLAAELSGGLCAE